MILVVEDDENIRYLLTELLDIEGYQTVAAANGEEALNLLKKNSSDQIKLILLDLMMPVKNGFEVSQELQADPVLSHIPVVLMSAAFQLSLAENKIPSQAQIEKPLDTDRLMKVVRQYCHETPAYGR